MSLHKHTPKQRGVIRNKRAVSRVPARGLSRPVRVSKKKK